MSMRSNYNYLTLFVKEPPLFSQMYVNDDGGGVLRTKLDKPFIDFSHISLIFTLSIFLQTRKTINQHELQFVLVYLSSMHIYIYAHLNLSRN